MIVQGEPRPRRPRAAFMEEMAVVLVIGKGSAGDTGFLERRDESCIDELLRQTHEQ